VNIWGWLRIALCGLGVGFLGAGIVPLGIGVIIFGLVIPYDEEKKEGKKK